MLVLLIHQHYRKCPAKPWLDRATAWLCRKAKQGRKPASGVSNNFLSHVCEKHANVGHPRLFARTRMSAPHNPAKRMSAGHNTRSLDSDLLLFSRSSLEMTRREKHSTSPLQAKTMSWDWTQ